MEQEEPITPLREVTGRLRLCAPCPSVAEAWVDIFDAAKRIRAARRTSVLHGSTGGALLASLRSSLGECYEKVKGEPALPYQPFEASRIKEFGALETPCIPLTDDLPPDVAAIVIDSAKLLRVLSPEEQEALLREVGQLEP